MSENRVVAKNRKKVRPRKLNFDGSRALFAADQNLPGLKKFRTIYGGGSRFIDDVDVIDPKPKKVLIVCQKVVGDQNNKENEQTSVSAVAKKIDRQHSNRFQNGAIESKKELVDEILSRKNRLVDLFGPEPELSGDKQVDLFSDRSRVLNDLNKNSSKVKSRTSSENVDDAPFVFNKKSRNTYTKAKKPVANRSSNTAKTSSKSKKNVRKEAENERLPPPLPVVPEKKMKLSANYRIPKLAERESTQIQTVEEKFDLLNET